VASLSLAAGIIHTVFTGEACGGHCFSLRNTAVDPQAVSSKKLNIYFGGRQILRIGDRTLNLGHDVIDA
jgi:hypothetical protein